MSTDAPETTETTRKGYPINPDLGRLIELQKLDSEIIRKRALLKRLPQEIEAAKAALNAAQQELDVFDQSSDADAKKRRELESEVEEIKNKIAQDKTKLPNVKTNVEYRALLKELDNYEKKISDLEEEELVLMEAGETRKSERQVFLDAVNKEEASFAVAQKEKAAAIAELEGVVTRLDDERSSVVEAITASVLASYERILGARDGVGVSPASDMTCQACNQRLAPQLYYNVRESGEMHSCPHCSRLLYYDGPELDEKAE